MTASPTRLTAPPGQATETGKEVAKLKIAETQGGSSWQLALDKYKKKSAAPDFGILPLYYQERLLPGGGTGRNYRFQAVGGEGAGMVFGPIEA